ELSPLETRTAVRDLPRHPRHTATARAPKPTPNAAACSRAGLVRTGRHHIADLCQTTWGPSLPRLVNTRAGLAIIPHSLWREPRIPSALESKNRKPATK